MHIFIYANSYGEKIVKNTRRRPIGKEDDGYSLVELTAATAGVLALTAGASYFVYNNVVEDNQQKALETAAATGYSKALDAMTSFAYDTDEETDEAITARLANMSTNDYTLDYAGDDADSLCVFATPGDWVVGEGDPSYYAASGSCSNASSDSFKHQKTQ